MKHVKIKSGKQLRSLISEISGRDWSKKSSSKNRFIADDTKLWADLATTALLGEIQTGSIAAELELEADDPNVLLPGRVEDIATVAHDAAVVALEDPAVVDALQGEIEKAIRRMMGI